MTQEQAATLAVIASVAVCPAATVIVLMVAARCIEAALTPSPRCRATLPQDDTVNAACILPPGHGGDHDDGAGVRWTTNPNPGGDC